MKRFSNPSRPAERGAVVKWLAGVLILFSLCFFFGPDTRLAQAEPKAFPSPDEAVSALIDAARSKNTNAVLAILGPSTKEWIVSGDRVQDEDARSRFIDAYDEKNAVELEGDAKAVLVVGNDGYPFPIPLIKTAGGWAFDPEQGREEILDRRIGENELNTIQTLLAIVDAQRDYASVDRDGDGLLEYAAKFKSAQGQKDGLYWPSVEGELQSPLGPLVIKATAEGYTPDTTGSGNGETNAYHGYRFKLLTRQGTNAPGGAHSYMVDGNMFGGFAILAYPVKYGASGIMTFAVSHDGAVYETDLGPETASAAKQIDTFDPDSSWKKAEVE